MRKIITLFNLLLLIALASNAQTTYTWNVARGDWSAASSWSPSRTAPAANDILIFNGSVTPDACATGIPTQTIGKLRIINNANVRFIGRAPYQGVGTISRTSTSVTGTGTSFTNDLKVGDLITNGTTFYGEVSTISSNILLTTSNTGTLTNVNYFFAPSINLNDGTTSALDIANGSTLTMSDTALVIRVLSGSKGQINGLVRMLNARQRLVAIDSLSLFIGSSGIVRTDSAFVGNAFTQVGLQNTVVFQTGSAYDYIVGSNPFALTAPASKVFFAPGSTYIQSSTSTPSVSGRTMANFRYNTSGTVNATQNSTATFDTLSVIQGQFNITSSGTNNIGTILVTGGVLNINQTAGSTNITGNVSVTGSGKLVLQGKFATSPANFCFRGTTPQSISGSGEIRLSMTADSAARIRIQNPTGLTLQRNLDLNASILDLDSGFINLNGNTLNLGSASFHGRATQLTGTVRGSGSFTKWYTAINTTAGDSSLFPVGGTGGTYPIWVYGTATGAGSVTLSNFTENAGVTTFSSPFSDSALTTGSITVNSRFGHSWTLTSGNGLAGTAFNVRGKLTTSSGLITDVTKMRLTLANGIAPGTISEDGGGTVTQPTAGKIGVTAAQLSNTFYMGSSTSSNPLDVNFLSINAKNVKGNNEVTWKTAQEINLNYFNIERLLDGKFLVVGKVLAQNSKLGASYSFIDLNNTCATYRVVGVDYNGKLTYSDLASTDCKVNQQVKITPNPVANVFSIGVEGATSIKVFNTLGEEMQVLVNGETVDVSTFKSGIYYLQITTNGQTQVVKFVKQ